MPDEPPASDEGPAILPERPPIEAELRAAPTSVGGKVRELVIGPPKDPRDQQVFHKISLIAFLAWVGLGADGLSSSAYGPEEAFKALLHRTDADYTFLAVFLAAATALTVFIISYTYSRIIEQFPFGGGGYVVATKLLGPKAGVVSGSALLVDYVLTIAISVASGADALWSTFPEWFSKRPIWLLSHYWHMVDGVLVYDYPWGGAHAKVFFEVLVIVLLIVMNLRGVKESVLFLMPIFMVFVFTHAVFIVGAVAANAHTLPSVFHDVSEGLRNGMSRPEIGFLGLLAIFVRAYSLGGGTYTGIEAVSNGIAIMREPRVQTAKRTMVYMAMSLAFTAGGIVLCYLLVGARPIEGKTMNAVLIERVAGAIHLGSFPAGAVFVFVTLVSEMLLLFVAAQAGFIDGPRVMANMALDSWFPHRFASLSDRLTTANGVLLMGGAATLALLSVAGSVDRLVVMYSINVFLTFSLSNMSMCRFWVTSRAEHPEWGRRLPWHILGLALCLTILGMTIYEKFSEGAWLTLVVTSVVILLCFMVKRHYDNVLARLKLLNKDLADEKLIPDVAPAPLPLVPDKPTAVILVSNWSGIGIHTTLNVFRYFPGYFANIVFASAAVIDSGNFKGARHVSLLAAKTEEMLKKYVAFASSQGVPATYAYSVGTEPVDEAERLCKEASKSHSKCMFFAGQLVFEDERWYHRLLHNNTAYAIQKRLQWDGLPMIILPVRVRGA
ncbi:APC family permease [bacterium]|nr:APC family permease [bacterium]